MYVLPLHYILNNTQIKTSYINTYTRNLRKMGQINKPMCETEIETQTQRKNIRSPKGEEGWDELGDGD